jgi:hypothetical protein
MARCSGTGVVVAASTLTAAIWKFNGHWDPFSLPLGEAGGTMTQRPRALVSSGCFAVDLRFGHRAKFVIGGLLFPKSLLQQTDDVLPPKLFGPRD